MSRRERLRALFAERDRSGDTRARYSFFNLGNLHIVQERERHLLAMLHRHGFGPERMERVLALSVGCGSATELLDLVRYGASAESMFGVDIEPDRLRRARARNPAFGVAEAEGQALPFRSAGFDLVMQFTLFTSVLDPADRRGIAAEMLRVLRPDGLIVWYDFWPDSPGNPDVRGIRAAEIRALFPNCAYDFRRLTLPPPLARAIVPVSRSLTEILALVPLLKTFHLVGIRRLSGVRVARFPHRLSRHPQRRRSG